MKRSTIGILVGAAAIALGGGGMVATTQNSTSQPDNSEPAHQSSSTTSNKPENKPASDSNTTSAPSSTDNSSNEKPSEASSSSSSAQEQSSSNSSAQSSSSTSDSDTGNAGKVEGGAGAKEDQTVNGKSVSKSTISAINKQIDKAGYDSSSWSPQDSINLYRKASENGHTSPSSITKEDIKDYIGK